MKIIKSGLFAKDGIHYQCSACKCEFLIEARNDWKIDRLENLCDLTIVVSYNVQCPECHANHHFGADPKKVKGLISEYIFFDREDWAERYEVQE